MKVIAYSFSNYTSSSSPMTHRLRAYMKALLSVGIEVEVFMVSVSCKEAGVFEGVGYSYEVIKSPRTQKKAFLKEFSELFARKARQCDVLFTSEDRNGIIAKLCDTVHLVGGKLVVELNENPYSIISSRKDFRFVNYFKRQYFKHFTLKKVDGVIAISRALYDLSVGSVRADAHVIRIPILSHFTSVEFAESPMPGSQYVLHAGSLSEQKDGIKAMLKAFAHANAMLGNRLKFVFTSTTAFPGLKRWIDSFVKENGLEKNIIFTGFLEESLLKRYMDNTLLAIINKPVNSQNNFNFPTKLTELLPRGIPCIISRTGELNYFFQDRVNAFLVKPDSWEEISARILDIVNNHEYACEVGLRGKELCEKEFYYKNHALELRNFYELVSNS